MSFEVLYDCYLRNRLLLRDSAEEFPRFNSDHQLKTVKHGSALDYLTCTLHCILKFQVKEKVQEKGNSSRSYISNSIHILKEKSGL